MIFIKKIELDEIAKELSELMPLIARRLIKPVEQQAKQMLSPSQMYSLDILFEKGTITMTELSTELQMSKQQMTPIIDKLVENGLVQREHDCVDRRTVKISITSTGEQFLKSFHSEVSQVIKEKLYLLGDDDIISLHDAINELFRVVNKIP